MTTNASREPIDLDAIARELQPSSPPSESPAAPVAKADPLAELARIVGHDDPFRTLLAARGVTFRQEAGRQEGGRVEPTFDDPAAAPPAPHEEAPQPQATPADAFDQYLASIEQTHQANAPEGAYEDPAAFESDDRAYSNAATERPRGRSRMFQVGAGLGVLALCVTGAFALKGFVGSSGNGEPVTVLADRTPLKVAPEKADGVEIPDQNKQIYERNGKDGQIKVVNREEQPLDVAQAARAASARESGQGGVTPGGMLTESLGEPRRIRTVAVKPDAPPPAMQQQREASAEPGAAPISPIPTMTMPGASSEVTPASGQPRHSPSTPAAAKPAPVQTADATQTAPTPPPAPRKAIQRVASVAPETTATIAPEAAPTPSAASTAPVGGFSVQLGVRSSEADAKAAFRQMQGKYAQLAGKPELIRQAEVNGKSLYRVRVGPLGKGEANSLCTALKGAGGQCFVAAN